MKSAEEEELFEFLRDIDARLEGESFKRKAALYVLGGAAAVLAYGSPRATTDIDAWVEDQRLQKKILEWAGEGTKLAVKHHIYFQPVNTTIMLIEEPQWRERSVEMLKGRLKNLRVMAVGKEDLILSKLSRYNDRDREDIRFVAENHKVNVEKLIAYYRAARGYYVGDVPRLDRTFNIVLEEHFGRKPLRFE